ncbi:hypothetical protein KCP77_24835 (plasmid) [Salmonella enterica subsp. enterica]|nr:hypothetical protein KCP77_24835 [Salmonella enterica subsp. enterica]
MPCGNQPTRGRGAVLKSPTLPGAGTVWNQPPCRAPVLWPKSAHLTGRRCRVNRPCCRAPVLCGNPPTLPGAGAV